MNYNLFKIYLFVVWQVAIKTIKKAKIETEADLVRIRREIQIMSSVQHPNIIHIYEGEFIFCDQSSMKCEISDIYDGSRCEF